MPIDQVRMTQATDTDTDRVVAALGGASFVADRRRQLAGGSGVLLAAWHEAEAVGCVYISFEEADEAELRERRPGTPVLHRLLVVEHLRRQGIGRRLMQTAENVARDRGCARMALGLDLDNIDAERFYRRLGYTEWPYGLLDTFYIATVDGREVRVPEQCRVMEKHL
ncbi:GNAT family N-acetyltransferase [Dactylosporangium sp. CA-152071]|uniref:GNAT family N-acetyltransferase n=1 Tax=Dactylosporangium sp. CA-152071 TaxID=3239933 RepID=UPI003D8A152C